MQIKTGISKDIIKKLAVEATEEAPSRYFFKINIDNKEYNACLYCFVIYEEKVTRNILNGIVGVTNFNKKTINRIEIYNLDSIYKNEMFNIKTFKVDKESYYLGEIETSILNDITTIIAVNTNQF